MVQNIATVFALQACLLILFGPKIFQMWRLRTERSQSSNPSQAIDDPFCSPSFCTREEQRRYELTLKQYGFLSAGKQATPPTSRRRKNSTVNERQSSTERQTLFFQEPTLKGPVAYNCTTGTLNGPDNNQNNKALVRQLGSQGVVSLHSENALSLQRHLGQGSQEDEDYAIPVLNETHQWLQRAMRQWRPMRVVVVVPLSLVILADVSLFSFSSLFHGNALQALTLKHCNISLLTFYTCLRFFRMSRPRSRCASTIMSPQSPKQVTTTCASTVLSKSRCCSSSKARRHEISGSRRSGRQPTKCGVATTTTTSSSLVQQVVMVVVVVVVVGHCHVCSWRKCARTCISVISDRRQRSTLSCIHLQRHLTQSKQTYGLSREKKHSQHTINIYPPLPIHTVCNGLCLSFVPWFSFALPFLWSLLSSLKLLADPQGP